MNIKEIRSITGLSQKKFADKYGIPRRTLESWETEGNGHRDPAEYALKWLERIVKEDIKTGA